MIQGKEIESLAKLSRLTLADGEKKGLEKDMNAILAYIDKLKKAPADLNNKPTSGSLRNVLRKDEILHTPGSFTENLLRSAPRREGKYVVVKKIL